MTRWLDVLRPRAARVATRPLAPVHDEAIAIARAIDEQSRRLFGRALAIREVDAGSCNGCEIEIGGMAGPVYDMERFGLHFVASPRHADLLLVTGPVTVNMATPLVKTWEATPDPKLVVGVGTCARTCGVFAGSYAVAGSVDRFVPVDAWVDGCPPEPADILRGILAALGRIAPLESPRVGQSDLSAVARSAKAESPTVGREGAQREGGGGA